VSKSKALKLIQEDFTVRPSSVQGRKKLVRQDRYDVQNDECYVELFGKSFKVLDLNSFGVALTSDEPIEADILNSAPLVFENIEVGQVNLTKVRHEKEETGSYKTAFEVSGAPINTEYIEAIKSSFMVIGQHQESLKKFEAIPKEFKALVLDVKDWLEGIQNYTNSLQSTRKFTSSEEKKNFEDAVCEVLADYFKLNFTKAYGGFTSLMNQYDDAKIKLCFEYFRSKLNELLHQSIFADRSYNKPLGYAGDFEMMNIIYRSENFGESLFEKALQRYYVQEPAARAVKNRSVYLKNKIKQEILNRKDQQVIKFLSVASGPAREVQLVVQDPEVQEFLHKVEFHFVDQDLSSLKHAQNKLHAFKKSKKLEYGLVFHNLAIKNIIGRGLPESDFDMIYSAGLYDYFTEPVAKMSNEKLYHGLKKGGRLIIGNFSMDNPDECAMTMALDWKLIYRSDDEMKSMFAHLPSEVDIEKEDEGVNLFANLIK
tara:strand:+ start:164302 stop:165753 length:1452 start_codon:yes stop_codon:yes gene_type:complete